MDEPIQIEVAETTPRSFSELYEEQFLPLVRFATLLVGRVEPARDVVQDAFVKLHVKWASVHDPLAYVRRSVVNGCATHHRREARRRRRETSDAGPTVELGVDHTLATLDVLTPRQRAIVVMKFYEQRSEREIADIVGCRPGSVGPTLQRALERLRTVQGGPAT